MTVAGVVLAAGGGTRFDGPAHKLLAEFRGRPLVTWAIEEARAAGFDQLYVVTGAVDLAAVCGEDVTLVDNPRWEEGQSTSLVAAIAAVRADGHHSLVVGLGDQPLVPAAAWRSVGAAAGPIVTATFDGERRPPVKLEASVWDDVPASGDVGARTLMRQQPDLVSEVPCRGNPVDIDTLEDLLRWS